MKKKKNESILVVGRRKIRYWHDNFEYYQPNDHVCGDCVIRAMTKAIGKSWKECLTILFEYAISMYEPVGSVENITEALMPYGFLWKPVNTGKGEKRPTVSEFAKQYKGKAILRVAGHVVAVQDGKYFDIWDSGDRSIYGYWTKENE